MTKAPLLALMALSLASCGGDSGSDDYQMAVQQADAKQAEAISLSPASPCNAVQQCASLQLVAPEGHCGAPYYRPYSLATPTADAASAAAADERALALHAISLAPPPIVACAAAGVAPPTLGCVANTCQAVAPAN
jgi:ABC-type phosphate/phosphonate transport system substrate-binding protein